MAKITFSNTEEKVIQGKTEHKKKREEKTPKKNRKIDKMRVWNKK